jgi:colanic acid biosynthesis protein WcaH
MKVNDNPIPDELYAAFLKRLPQVSVELFLETERGVLLLRRTNEPAAGEWFWPGTRLFKGESFQSAAKRLSQAELGIEVELGPHLGTYSHFWDTAPFDEVGTTHTVNVVYRATTATPGDIELDDQHNAVRFVEHPHEAFHDYVNAYLRDAGYPEDRRE